MILAIVIIALLQASGQNVPRQGAAKTPEVVGENPGAPSQINQHAPGPFGFEAGMTRDAVVAKLGANAVVRSVNDVVMFNTAPTPHPEFPHYTLMFSPTKGLVKLVAISRSVETNRQGEQLKEYYTRILDSLKAKYGSKPTVDVDLLVPGSLWTENGEWMMSLLKQERKVEAIWDDKSLKDPASLPAHLSTVLIQASALDQEKGNVMVVYEFDTFQSYQAEKNAKRDSVF